MNGSENIEMTINIGNEFIKVSVPTEDQPIVREAVAAIKRFTTKTRNTWPNCTESQILAMTAYQFAFWHRQLQRVEAEAMEMAAYNNKLIDGCINS